MQCFFISGNIASKAALVGFLLQLGGMGNSELLRIVTAGAILATVVFWIFFYFSPANRLSATIRAKLDYSGKYQTFKGKQVDIFEGSFELNDFIPLAVAMPPFESPPDISVFQRPGRHRLPPTVTEVTRDVVTFSTNRSESLGTWAFRARGKALTQTANQSDA